MLRLRAIITSLAGGAMWLPLFASGHGSEMIQARLQFDHAGAALLEMTADYGGNPMLQSETEARTALQDLLRVEVAGQQHKLTDLAPLHLEPRDQLDPTSPMPLGPEDAGVKHQLITAVWRWRPTGDSMRFTVPEGSFQDVLFWKLDEQAKPQWRVLLAGDFTPPISPQPGSLFPSLIGLLVLCVLLHLAYRLWCRKFPCPLTSTTPSSDS